MPYWVEWVYSQESMYRNYSPKEEFRLLIFPFGKIYYRAVLKLLVQDPPVGYDPIFGGLQK